MLRSAKEIIGYELAATDGTFGRCKDFLFDDRQWGIRYMVADTGTWLPGRRVLISPISLEEPDWDARRLKVALTREQIENSPSLSEDEPVSKQFEIDYYGYYEWPFYWVGPGVWGPYALPRDLRHEIEGSEEPGSGRAEDPHLRSTREVTGYRVAAADREIGHIDDLIVSDEEWIVRYIVVDTRNWLPGRRVLVDPGWFTGIEWPQGKAHTDLTADEIENSPEFDPSAPINREYERKLYDYYGRPVYWE